MTIVKHRASLFTLTIALGVVLPTQVFAQSTAPASCSGAECSAPVVDRAVEFTTAGTAEDGRPALIWRRYRRRSAVPYAGGPVPGGYRIVRRDERLIGMGVGVFLFGYAPSLVIGYLGFVRGPIEFRWSLIPLVGLSVTAGTCFDNAVCRPSGTLGVALVVGAGLSTVVQAAGLIIAIVGLTSPQYLVPYRIVPHALARRRIEWGISPWATHESAGLGVTVAAM